MSALMVQSLSIFFTGILTSLTPCVYPMIPLTLGYLGMNAGSIQQKRLRVLGFILGQIVAFTLLGVLAVSLGEILGFSAQMPAVQIGTGLLLMVLAAISYGGALPGFLNRWNSKMFAGQSITLEKRPMIAFYQAVGIGAISSLVASPCSSPLLGGVLASISQTASLVTGALLMFLYASGLSLLFLVLGLGMVQAKKMPKGGKFLVIIHKMSTILLVTGGFYFITQGIRGL